MIEKQYCSVLFEIKNMEAFRKDICSKMRDDNAPYMPIILQSGNEPFYEKPKTKRRNND